jgi:hypothetical protein
MMHECGTSASAIVAGKPANEVGQSTEEPVEQRAGTKGMRTSEPRVKHRTGKACQLRWIAYDESQGKGKQEERHTHLSCWPRGEGHPEGPRGNLGSSRARFCA